VTQLAALAGLTAAEVAQRTAAGRTNAVTRRTSRSGWSIVRANVLTRFNAIFGVLLAVVLIFGQPQDGLFGLVIVVNSAVGIVQELRAKRKLDALALLERAPVRVRRDGVAAEVPPKAVVVDDVVLLSAGAKVPVDGEVVQSAGLEVDESLLTGEPDPVAKAPGDPIRSGSFVVAGSGALVATKVGDEAYANQLVAQASRFELAHSELMAGINSILRALTWVIVPLGILLVISQFSSTRSLPEAMVGSVAGIVPMIPEGLVLMTSVAFAVGVIRLARHQCLVQELPAIEVLARVDTLCLDKTGTLTAPEMDFAELRLAPGLSAEEQGTVRPALAALASLDEQPNATMRAIASAIGPGQGWRATETVPFSSARKFSGAVFDGRGGWIMGAPDVILPVGDALRGQAESLAAGGLRVLALARADGRLPTEPPLSGVKGQALVVLRQRLRPDAAETMRYLTGEGVHVKVISGDNAASVASVAAAVGLPNAESAVDARELPEEPEGLAAAVEQHTVFGRVTPEQKRRFVAVLRDRGHTVGMTGDGVNDALALKDADLGIAMGSGSPATRGVAKIVLLNDSFAAVPRVLAEGRRVLANIERVASLFLVKTMYALVLAVLVGVAHVPFPLLPRHVTLVGSLTIGIPGFFLALAPNTERARPGFVGRVLRRAVPAGLVSGVAAFVAYGLARVNTASDQVADRSAAALTLFLCAAWVLVLVARPYTLWKVVLVAGMVGAFVLVATVPVGTQFFALDFSDPLNDLIAVMTAAVGVALITVLYAIRRASDQDGSGDLRPNLKRTFTFGRRSGGRPAA